MAKQRIFKCTDQIILWFVVNILVSQVQYSYGMMIQDLNLDHSEGFPKANGSLGARIMTSYDELIIEKILLNCNDAPSWNAVSMMFLVFIVSPLFVLPLLWFLQDLPLNKQCIMSYLYQDVLKANLLFVCFWTLSGMTFKILSENYMIDYLGPFVEFAAIANEALYSVIMIHLCLTGGLRLYISKFNVLDPLTETFGTNEGRISQSIRITLISFGLFVVAIILTTSTKPVSYFQILNSSGEIGELPLSTLLLFLFDVGLCLITTALHICVKFYQMNQDSKLQKEIIELEAHLNRNLAVADSSVDIPVVVPPLKDVENEGFMIHKQTLPVVIFMASSMMIMVLLLLNFFHAEKVTKIDFWWSLTVFISNQGLFIPILLIMWNPAIRIYYRRKIICIRNNATAWFTNMARKSKRRTLRKINPVSSEENEMDALECIVLEYEHTKSIA